MQNGIFQNRFSWFDWKYIYSLGLDRAKWSVYQTSQIHVKSITFYPFSTWNCTSTGWLALFRLEAITPCIDRKATFFPFSSFSMFLNFEICTRLIHVSLHSGSIAVTVFNHNFCSHKFEQLSNVNKTFGMCVLVHK